MSEAQTAGFGVVLDCGDASRLGEFWAAALRYTNVGMFGAYCVLVPPGGDGPKMLLQNVPEPKTSKNRMHLDLDAHDVEDEVARLVALGAARLDAEPCHEHGVAWVRMTDPEGNEFCVCDFSGV